MNIIRKCFAGFMLPLLLCLLLLVPTFASASAPVEIPQGYKVVRTEKLELLKSNNDKLVLKLAELETKLQLLKKPSTELASELQLCKQELASAKLSLQNAKDLQERTQQSLEVLEQKLEQEKRHQAKTEARLRRQRDTWLFVAGAFMIYGITK